MMMPGRKYSPGTGYRYGFNGKENDNEVKGEGGEQDYGMRIYNPRIGKFLSVDPIAKNYPHYSPYHFAGNTPVMALDLDGKEPLPYWQWQYGGWCSIDNYKKIQGSADFVKVVNFGDLYDDGHNYVAIRDQKITNKWWFATYDDQVGSLGNEQKGNWKLYDEGLKNYASWTPEGWQPDDVQIKNLAKDVGVFGQYYESAIWNTTIFLTTGGIGSSQIFGTTLLGRFGAALTEDVIAQGLTTGFHYENANLTSLGGNYLSARFRLGFIAKNVIASVGEYKINGGFSIANSDFSPRKAAVTATVGILLDGSLDKMRIEPNFNMQQYSRLRNLSYKPKFDQQFQHLNLNYGRKLNIYNVGNNVGAGIITNAASNIVGDNQ